MQLKRLGHVFLVVSDAQRAKDFYTRVLGFEIIEEDPAHGGVFMALREGGHVLDLVGIGGDAPPIPRAIEEIRPRHGVGHVAFEVEDKTAFEASVAELRAKGVNILGATDHASQESVYFCDPDGNVLEIYWERPGARAMFAAGREDEDRPLDA